MDDIPTRSPEKGPPFRPPLITPSASPPVSRLWSHKDRPPPSKKPRLSSTPSSSSSAQPPSSSSSVADLRLESSSRLFQFWDQLAGRYNKPLDEDDIIDFRNFKIIKDRGVVRSAASPYSIGSLLAVAADPEDAKDEGEGNPEEEEDGDGEGEGDDDSADELDLIAPPPIVPVKLEYYKTWYVPPPDERDPEDAEAFREFEEAEKRRRQLYGDLDDEEEEEEALVRLEEEEDPGVQPHQADEQEAEADPGQDEHERPPSPSPKRMPQRRKSRPPKPIDNESSEDELAAAEVDNTPIPPRQSVYPANDIIDLTDSPPSSPGRAHRGRLPSKPPKMQPGASSRGRSKSKLAASAAEKPAKTPERLSSPELVLQLLTPPRSSSAIESTPDTLHDDSPVSRAETPSPKLPKARLRYTPRPRTPSEDREDGDGRFPFLNIGERTATRDPFPVGPPKKAKKKPLPAKPEVVITTSPRRLHGRPTSARAASTEPASSPSMAAVKRKSAKAMGKETAASELSSSAGASRVSRPRRSQSQPRGSMRESTEEFSSPQPRPPSRGTKRRRVSSLSSLSDGSPAKPVTPEPLPTTARSTRKQHDSRSSFRSGYSSDAAPPTSTSIRADDEDEDEPSKLSSRNHYRAGSLIAPPVPQIPPLYPPPYPLYPPPYALYTPRHHDHDSSASSHRHHAERDERHTPFPQVSDPQAQHYMTQAWYSYFMASGAFHPPPPPPGPSFPPGLPFPSAPWPPYTPSHRRHHTVPPHVLDTPSSEAGPSRSSTYSTPTRHPHPYPYAYDPRFSSSTLPPSSPIPSSPPSSSPVLRPASVAPGQRSRSRGRRVSFKLDGNDRPLPPTPPRRHDGDEEEVDSDDEPLTSLQARWRGASAFASASAKSSAAKGKGKARAEPAQCEEEDEDGPPRGWGPPRARTPGPPSRHAGSVPQSSAKAFSSSSQPKSATKRRG